MQQERPGWLLAARLPVHGNPRATAKCGHIAVTCGRGSTRTGPDAKGADFANPQVRRCVTNCPVPTRMLIFRLENRCGLGLAAAANENMWVPSVQDSIRNWRTAALIRQRLYIERTRVVSAPKIRCCRSVGDVRPCSLSLSGGLCWLRQPSVWRLAEVGANRIHEHELGVVVDAGQHPYDAARAIVPKPVNADSVAPAAGGGSVVPLGLGPNETANQIYIFEPPKGRQASRGELTGVCVIHQLHGVATLAMSAMARTKVKIRGAACIEPPRGTCNNCTAPTRIADSETGNHRWRARTLSGDEVTERRAD